MKILINKVHFPVTVLGPGRRLGIWTQGCRIRCAGCVSRDTWEPDPARVIEIDDLLQACRSLTGDSLDGVTISGGEPFDQPEALEALLSGLHQWRERCNLRLDLLAYSGYPLAHLETHHRRILAGLDALIPEPFRQRRPEGAMWRGSDNQTLVPLSELGRERFASALTEPAPGKRALQVSLAAGMIWYIGIPRRGDMDRLQTACSEGGLLQEAVSWRS